MDYLFLLDRNPDTTVHTQDAAPAHLFSAAEAVHLLTVPDPAATLLSADGRGACLCNATPPPRGGTGGPCPHMTALMDSSNQPIRESSTGLVILVETH
jgi:hypothetical protein